MAPTSKRRRTEKPKKKTSTETTRRIITRSIYKKEQLLLNQKPATKAATRRVETSSFDKNIKDAEQVGGGSNEGMNCCYNNTSSNNNIDVCSTPKSEKYKIPEIKTCPPAPMKPRNSKSLFQTKRRPMSFFAHPDIDKFFVFAMNDIKV